MKIKSILIAMVLFVTPVFASQNYPLTTPYNIPALSAVFPASDNNAGIEVTPSSGVTTVDKTSFTGNMYVVSARNGNASFGVAYFDYATTRATGSDNLDNVIDGSISAMKMVLVPNSRENTSFAGLFAREGHSVSDTLEAYTITTVVGSRCYLSVVVFDKSLHGTEQDANDFFASVRQGR
jgi:hypothetical protein